MAAAPQPKRGEGRVLRGRREAAAEAAEGCWEGTADLVEAFTLESRHVYGWRPLRAALLLAREDAERAAISDQKGGMSGPEFAAWMKEAKAVLKVRGLAHGSSYTAVEEALGIGPDTRRSFARNGAPKLVALACAHVLFGFALPVPPEDPEAFDAWYRPRFMTAASVADWLQVDGGWIGARLSGFETLKGERVERLPPAYLIRALDWLWRMGPVSPYGQKAAVPIWPGQDVAALPRSEGSETYE